jgi:hypothetical protein
LQKINDEYLLINRKRWLETIEKREKEMIENIYEYSRKHEFNKGLFFIGATRRENICEKIIEFNEKNDFKMNWFNNIVMYNTKEITCA